ncbi:MULTISPECIES: hypothetical protein [unclassified Corynebacterium]|uniref:hypothetical protein n=1 Tax=unclassified Corynebacterium TaxID=2624378 RepID=UPI0029CA8105|nr:MULTISPECIES: hypothetical protein [unclassified Corynebacterium]WPF65551.1 hypothetical protein OLX12_08185 [Corynebacterium sp. 22KM0430]WPF68046.1 hypothetical protein OLW90_08180 [Corynebacterium sp. 21KM1197]
MHRIAAELRHRELTQELYDIGDEVAEYIEHIAQAIADWDAELVQDCLAEFEEIVADARLDSRVALGELTGLRQALTSGLRSGRLSARPQPQPGAEPAHIDASVLRALHPLESSPVIVAELAGALDSRTESVQTALAEVVDWVLESTDVAANDLEALSLPHFYSRVRRLVLAATEGWLECVAHAHPAYARAKRGNNPPEFLAERARISAVVARVAQRRQQAAGSGAAS